MDAACSEPQEQAANGSRGDTPRAGRDSCQKQHALPTIMARLSSAAAHAFFRQARPTVLNKHVVDTDSLNRICSGVLRVTPSPSKQDDGQVVMNVEAAAGGDLQAELLPVAEEAERMQSTAAHRQQEREPGPKRHCLTVLEEVQLRLIPSPSKQDGGHVRGVQTAGVEAAASGDLQAELLPGAEEAECMKSTAAERLRERERRPKRKRMTALEVVERWLRVSSAGHTGQEVFFDIDTCEYVYKR